MKTICNKALPPVHTGNMKPHPEKINRLTPITHDQFRSPLKSFTQQQLTRYAHLLWLGFNQQRSRPTLFVFNAGNRKVYADLDSTKIMKIWEVDPTRNIFFSRHPTRSRMPGLEEVSPDTEYLLDDTLKTLNTIPRTRAKLLGHHSNQSRTTCHNHSQYPSADIEIPPHNLEYKKRQSRIHETRLPVPSPTRDTPSSFTMPGHWLAPGPPCTYPFTQTPSVTKHYPRTHGASPENS